MLICRISLHATMAARRQRRQNGASPRELLADYGDLRYV
jgi:hypothetical protein